MSSINLIIVVSGILNLLLGSFVLSRNPKRASHLSFFVFALGIFCWLLGFALLSHTQIFIYDKLTLFGALLVAGGIFLFSEVFPGTQTFSFTKKTLTTLLPLVVLALLLPFNVIIESVQFIGTRPVPQNGPLYWVFAVTLVGYFLASIRNIRNQLARANPLEKNRIFVFSFALISFLVLSFITNIALPFFAYYELNVAGPILSLLFVFVTSYAIVVKRLLDVKLIVHKTILYSVLIILVSLVYLSLVYGAQEFLSLYSSSFVSALLASIISALSFPYLDSYLRRVTDAWLFKGSYSYAHELLLINQEISKAQQLHELIQTVVTHLNRNFRTRAIKIVIAGTRQSPLSTEPIFTQHGRSFCVPIIDRGTLIASLYCGPKKSGDRYLQRDVEFVQTLCFSLTQRLSEGRKVQQLDQYSRDLEGDISKTKDDLKQINESQNTMIVDIAHNLQTPLTILKGEVDSLKDRQKDFTLKDLERLDASIDTFSQFVSRLLQAGNTSKHFYSFKETDVSQVIEEISEYSQTVAHSQDIDFTYDIQQGIVLVADALAIRDLVLNLLSNAMKYRRDNTESKISLSLFSNENKAVLIVKDNGIGIEASQMQHIFKPWVQGDTQQQGSGLGMAIIKKVSDAHNGDIVIESKAAQGTEVSISFPLAKKLR